MFKKIFTGVKDFNADNRIVRSIVDSYIFGKPMGCNFKLPFFKTDISGIYLRIVANFHLNSPFLKVKSVDCNNNNFIFFFLNNRHYLFDMIKLLPPFSVILKVMPVSCPVMFSRNLFFTGYSFSHFLFGSAAFYHLFLSMRRKYDFFHTDKISHGVMIVKKSAMLLDRLSQNLKTAFGRAVSSRRPTSQRVERANVPRPSEWNERTSHVPTSLVPTSKRVERANVSRPSERSERTSHVPTSLVRVSVANGRPYVCICANLCSLVLC